MSLFERIEEFSLQEDMFGLQGDLLLDGELDGTLGLIPGEVGHDVASLKCQQQPATQASLESLVIPDTLGDSFGEDWMETVDLSSLLNGPVEASELPSDLPDLVEIPAQLQPTKPQAPQPRQEGLKEGLKPLAFELLKQLLTCPVTETKVETLDIVSEPESLPSSPEVQVLDLQQFFTTPVVADSVSLDLLAGTEELSSGNCSLEDLIEIKPEVISLDSMVECEDQLDSGVSSPAWGSPQSVASIHSYSSMPGSPDSLQTIDSSPLGELNDSYSQVSENDFVDIKPPVSSRKSKRESKSRTTPYDIDDRPTDKKSRKKVQNKNAATRYRVKKRIEKQTLGEQEQELNDKNKELKEKVESLQREISYMKELMTEIQKAKLKKY